LQEYKALDFIAKNVLTIKTKAARTRRASGIFILGRGWRDG
jgi:hypothetical protein